MSMWASSKDTIQMYSTAILPALWSEYSQMTDSTYTVKMYYIYFCNGRNA